MQCVAVTCSALQCFVVRCSALQCIAVHCSALQCIAVCSQDMPDDDETILMQYFAVYAVCFSVLQCIVKTCQTTIGPF